MLRFCTSPEKLGYAIQEVAIDWYYNPDSRVRLLQDSVKMALDLLKIRVNDNRGLYDVQT